MSADASDAAPAVTRESELTPSTLSFPVVGIGASAGGLNALLRFFEHMPGEPGMAFVVILHLSPKHASNVHSVLQGVTKMPVAQVIETTRIEADRVYVIPPTKQLRMNDGVLAVSSTEPRRGGPVAIDLFFRSLAVVHRARSMAIVLSGTGSDGAVGIARIKEQGGLTFAQSPDDAEFDGMPRAAIATQAIDWVLPVVEMPAKLIELWVNARNIELPPSELVVEEPNVEPPPNAQARQETEAALRDIMTTLRARTGHDFRHYKRATVLRRLGRRLQVNGLPNLLAYREHLKAESAEAQALLKDLLIGVTNFFRDRAAFDALESQVVPALFGAAGEIGALVADTLRVWVPGCATGEESYSVAMLLFEYAQRLPMPPQIQIFASDIDEQAIAAARVGAYPESIAADVTPVRLRQFFNKEGNHYRVRSEVRERMLFATHNILRDPPFSKLDLVCCRNLLIYLDRDVHAGLLEMFHFALQPGGYLFLGSAESADAAAQLFGVVDKKHRIYRANAVPRAARPVPALPLGSHDARAATLKATQVDRRKLSYAELHQRLAEQYAPPSVVIDANGNIAHLSDRVGRFLLHAGGAPSYHLLTLVRPELRLELRTALFQAMRSGKSVEARRVQIDRDGRHFFVHMIVRPVPNASRDGSGLVLVLFNEVEETLIEDSHAQGDRADDPVVTQLEQELLSTREQLQQTVEQAEASNEELRAANEELQSINEELRSATEELETSKEELQSINEELMTVNNELKNKVEETGRLNDDLQNLIAANDVATVFIDRALRIKRYTPRATELFSLIVGDVGRPLLDIAHRLGYPGLADDAAEVFRTLRTIEREVASQDGRWYLARMVPYRTLEDRIEGAVLSFLDITERRRSEERARVDEARLKLVADSTEDYAIVTFDAAERITSWNTGAERLFGYAAAEAIGQAAELLFLPEDRARGVPQLEMRRARDDGRADDDSWLQRKDGSRIYVSGIMTALVLDGVLHGYAKIARDVTGSKRAADEREALLSKESDERAQAQAANQLKDEFLAVMSHELKNPLNLIQLNAELLTRLPEARSIPSVERAADIIRRTVAAQAKIIDDLLDLSRINTGKLALHLSAVQLAPIVHNIVAAMADEAARKRLALVVQAPEQPLVVHADPVRVEQIVWNLLSNALKFTPEGGAVAVRLYRDNGCGVLEVRDSGQGIAPEFLPRVFGMFQQADAKRRRQGGLGIGLALVQQLAQMHGGRVEGTSTGEGQGATFTVWLPEEDATAPASASAVSSSIQLKGLRALVVDDDAPSVDALRELLRIEGLDVSVAHGAAEALEQANRQRFDVVISDIAMPGMDGYQLVQALRGIAAMSATPAIALSGFGRAADAERALAVGFSAHLSKPVSVERLVQTLVEVLRVQ